MHWQPHAYTYTHTLALTVTCTYNSNELILCNRYGSPWILHTFTPWVFCYPLTEISLQHIHRQFMNSFGYLNEVTLTRTHTHLFPPGKGFIHLLLHHLVYTNFPFYFNSCVRRTLIILLEGNLKEVLVCTVYRSCVRDWILHENSTRLFNSEIINSSLLYWFWYEQSQSAKGSSPGGCGAGGFREMEESAGCRMLDES